MKFFVFDLQRFDTQQIISANETFTLDGVIYTALDGDATLNLDDDGKVSGIASGKVSAVVAGAESSPTITFDGSTAFDFTCAEDDGALNVRYQNHSLSYTSGSITYSSKGFTFPKGDVGLTSTLGKIIPFNINVAVPESGLAAIFDGDKFNLASTDTVTVAFTFPEEIKSIVESEVFKGNVKGIVVALLNISDDSFEKLYGVAQQLVTSPTTFKLSGEFTYDRTDKSFSFAQDSKLDIGILNYNINLAAVDGVLDGFRAYREKADDITSVGLKVSPSSGNGKLYFNLSEGGNTLFKDVLKLNSGMLTIDLTNAKLSLDANSSFTMTVRNIYTATIASTDAISATFSADAAGNIVLTPDGKVFKVTLKRDDATVFDGTVQISNGLLLFNQETHSITLTQGTTVTFTQDDYSFSLTATAAAGTQIVADENGVYTITPGKNDGSLDIAIKRNGETIFQSTVSVDGPISFDLTNKSLTLADGTTVSLTFDDYTLTATADGNASSTLSVTTDGNSIASNTKDNSNASSKILLMSLEIGGVFSYRPETVTFGLTGANSSHGDGTNTFAQFTAPNGFGVKTETNDTTVVFIPTFADGKLSFNFPNENKHSMKFTLSKDGQTTFENNLAIDGTVGFDTAKQEISLIKDTVLTLTQGENTIEITALDDASGQLTFTDSGIRFAPNENDGALELNFVSANRKANIDVTGAIVLSADGKISLEDGTEVNLTWEDGNSLKLTSSGSTGSIGFSDKGLRITSDDENLNMTFTTPSMSTDISGIKGTIYYNAGTVSFDENSTITATTTLGGQPIFTTLEALDGTGHISFNTTNGVLYAADTGALRVTWSRDDLKSTFTVNEGSVQIGHNLFSITEGSDLATDLKTFVPALYFTTSDAGEYTINGQKITTSAEGLALTATDDYMTFTTSDDAVTYDGMTFAGAGKVSLSPDNVVLGAGVEATGFGEGNSFVLAEAGNVTADAKIFELSKIEGTPREIPMIITVTGAQDGFIFSRTLTKESEAYLDDALDDEKFENYSSSYIGKVFTEKFTSAGDSSYRIRTDAIGLEDVIGISDGATITCGASLADEPTLSYYNIVTDTEGTFTIGEKPYSVSGDSSVAITARFEVDKEPYASAVASLNGTISGDFTSGEFKINGSSGITVLEDTDVSIVADASGFEVLGLDADASLKVSAADTYVVNGTTINANAGDYIVGLGESAAFLMGTSNDTLITGTENDDTIANSGASVTINALGGNDLISNFAASVSINAGNGDNYVENVAESVTIISGAGNDTIYNVPGNLNSTGEFFVPGKNSVNAGAGDDWIKNNSISSTINGGAGNDSIYNVAATTEVNGKIYKPADDLINGGDGDDYIENAGENVTINAGAGNNQIKNSGKNEVILLKGRTTVEGFNTGFGDGSDTIYINPENDPAGVEFLEDGLTFGNDTASLTLSDVNTTAKVNLFHENRDVLNKGVFIATGDWYKVEDSDLTVNAGEEVYFVGTAAKPTAGVDFSNITADLNITMNTEWEIPDNTMWVNGIYSLKGGAGLTTITGSTENDTIITGSGSTTINAAGGDDLISLTGGSALINYTSGDGNDSISGFNSTSTLQIAGGTGTYSSQTSGNDIIVTVGESKITLIDAASLSSAKIESANPAVQLVETILKRTAAGYPAMAAIAFDPEGKYGDEPTNYSAKEDWNITSADNLKLHAVHYTPENSNDKWVVLIHGYGNNHTAMYSYATAYLANSYNVLMIDQRTAGESEGEWLTMGAAESADVALWTQEIARRNSNAKITLHGVSMGSATAMLAASRSDATNITALVEDCGYSSAMEVFYLLNDAYVKAPTEVIAAMDPVGKEMTGYYLHNAAPINSISSAKMPTLFITGDADSVVPVSMLSELYDASGAEVKEKFILEGVPHALAGLDYPVEYNNAVFRFVAEANSEGWNTANTTDNISLRGTNYDDTITNSGTNVTIDGAGGNDYIENNVDSSLAAASLGNSINGGAGNDTLYSYHTYNPTLLGGEGNDSIVVERGHKNYIEGGNGNDTIIGTSQEGGWGMGNYSTILGGEGDDYINPIYSAGASIDGGSGNDTILANGTSATLDGGAGNNLIVLTDSEGGVRGKFVVLNGNTTVENFNTGFDSDLDPEMGEGTDTVYIKDESPAVDFKDEGLTLYYDDDDTKSLTFSDISTTAKLNLYYEQSLKSVAEVFIADDEWYSVTGNDLSVRDDSELWFVGATAKMNHGIDFSGISSALNITLNTDYEKDVENFRINNIHSIKGGAGATTITGSDKADTIIAGSGKTTINAGAGNNLVNLADAESARIQLAGNTTVKGFQTGFGEGTDTIYIDGDPAGVYFKNGVLAFGNSTDSLTMSDITTTAKVNIYHERRQMLNKGVFIAAGDWYKVEDSDLTVAAGEEVYFVGTAADPKAGVDFSGISSALNLTLDTAYIDSEDYVPGTTTWINGVYSIKGGAGLTTITGSKNSDTIVAGSGKTTINAGASNDVISLSSASALVQYNSGDGNDLIRGFNENSTLQIGDGTQTYSTLKSGSDIVVSVGYEEITLTGAANLYTRNITGSLYDFVERIKDRVGIAPVATYSDEDFTDETLDLTKSEGSQEVSLTSGNQTLKFNDDGGNLAVVEDGDGVKTIMLGNGGDVVIDYANSGQGNSVTVIGGTGNDTLYTFGTAPVTFDMINGGKDKISSRFNGENITLKNYKASLGGGIATGNTNTQSIVTDIIDNNQITFGDNEIRLKNDRGTSAKFTFESGAKDYNIFNMFDANGKAQAIGFTNSDGGTLNLSKESASYLLVGNYYDDKGSSTITGGAGNDTLLGGGGDVLNAGAGRANRIILRDDDDRDGASIILSEGKTTVENFKTGFDDSDRLFFGVNDVIDFKFDGTNVSVNNNNAWHGVLSDIASNDSFVNILAADANGSVKIAVAQEGAVITVDDELADFYTGKNSGVDFTNYEETLFVNLGSEKTSLGGGDVLFSGINQITLGSGQGTLMGAATRETLTAGTGTASIWGNAGNDTLIGKGGSADKFGKTTFFFLAGDGYDVISNFEFLTEKNRYEGIDDKIEITAANEVTDVFISDNDVVLQINDSDNYLRIKDAVGKDFRINNLIAKVDRKNLAYDGLANCYVAKGVSSLTVDSSVGSAEIWLDSSHGTFFLGEIRTLDASAVEGNTSLVGNEFNNTIIAGQGDASLWGGFTNSDDLLQGGTGKNTFFYCTGNGRDTVSGVNDGDEVILSTVMLDQIISTNITADAVSINFIDGGSLTVNGRKEVTYQLADGSKYFASHERLEWISKT